MLKRLTDFLDTEGVAYEIRFHPEPAATQEAERFARVVMVRAGDGCLLAVLPAPYDVSLDGLAEATGIRRLRLASEFERDALFPACEPGTLPPFGNLYRVPVWVDASFAPGDEIVFPVGRHDQTVRMAYGDFVRLVQPRIGSFRKETERS